MPTSLSALFSSNVLIQVFDRVFDFDIYDLRVRPGQFSFFSAAGIALFFTTIFLTGHGINSHVALGCSMPQAIVASSDCHQTWLAVVRLIFVLAVAYGVARLLGRWVAYLQPASATLEQLGFLFIATCIALIGLHVDLGRQTLFARISDLASWLLGTDGTWTNVVAVAAASILSTLLALFMTVVKRYRTYGLVSWRSPSPFLLTAHYIVFTTIAVSLTFYRFG